MTTVFSATLSAENTGNQNTSNRVFFTPSTGGLGQVRVTFQAGTASNWKTTNCSIAVLGTATPPAVQSTPTTLTFNGGSSGFNISAAASLASDWANFNFLSTDTLCVTMDDDTSGDGDGGAIAFGTSVTNVGGAYFGTPPKYNVASGSGFSALSSGDDFGVILIETQALSGGTIQWRSLMGIGQ